MNTKNKNIIPLNSKVFPSNLKHLKFGVINDEHVAILIDHQEFEIVKGYGTSQVEAINDLHNNLI